MDSPRHGQQGSGPTSKDQGSGENLGRRSAQQDHRPPMTIFSNTLSKAKVLKERGDRAALRHYLGGTDRDFAKQIPDSAKVRAKALELQALAQWAGLDYRLVELLERRHRS
jgi:hypothetical protein